MDQSAQSRPSAAQNPRAVPATDDEDLVPGDTGAALLRDHYLVRRMHGFNDEHVPERAVHAKGGGAYGFFETTEDVSQFTKAVLFQKGKRTDLFIRFSTVVGERGYPDTTRDPRGFAIKFYTEHGNYDMVGNNAPVYFIREPEKFWDLISAQKRQPGTDRCDNNKLWEFWTLSPESSHMVTWMMGDRGLPRSWRHMNGYSSHTYMWINASARKYWVKYHFKSDQGVENLTEAEGRRIAGEDPDFHVRDLFGSIESGDHPAWALFMQVMPFEDAADYRFNPFDLTKVWPHSDYPLIKVGRMVLNRNPENYFAEVEQSAFEPNNLVPGIGPSPDKMLLARLFSYQALHNHRLGPDGAQLSVNVAKNPSAGSYHSSEGSVYPTGSGTPVYVQSAPVSTAASSENFGEDPAWHAAGEVLRSAYTLHAEDDDFIQANALVNRVMDDAARDRLVTTAVDHLRQGVTDAVLSRAFEYWRNVDGAIGGRIARSF